MKVPKVATQSPSLIHFPGLVHFLAVLVVTGVEIVGLVKWLQLEQGADLNPVLGQLSTVSQIGTLFTKVGAAVFAAGLLGVFLIVEHVIAQMDQTGRRISAREFVEVFGFSALEAIVWTVWFLLISVNGILAFVFFLALLYVEHQITDNVKKGLPFLHFSPAGTRVSRGLLVFTLFEVVGSVLWLALISMASLAYLALVPLAVGSFTEHYIARNVGQIRD